MSLSFNPDVIEFAIHTKSGNVLVTGGFATVNSLMESITNAWQYPEKYDPIEAAPGILAERGYYGAVVAEHNLGTGLPWPQVLLNPASIESILSLR